MCLRCALTLRATNNFGAIAIAGGKLGLGSYGANAIAGFLLVASCGHKCNYDDDGGGGGDDYCTTGTTAAATTATTTTTTNMSYYYADYWYYISDRNCYYDYD